MTYEDDYKAWLEKALIETNPDWVCDGMCDTEFTHDWCSKYCGKDDAYITPKCLHMYYHHIATADRKTESDSEKPNNSTISKMEQVEEPQMGDAKPIPLSNRVTHIKDEPQTDAVGVPMAFIDEAKFKAHCLNCQRDVADIKCLDCDGDKYFLPNEPQTDCAWK